MAFQNLIRRKSKAPHQNFTRVKNTEFDKEGSVEEFLAKQFTVNYDDQSFGFLFYVDNGVTWHPLDETKKKTREATFQDITWAQMSKKIDFNQFTTTTNTVGGVGGQGLQPPQPFQGQAAEWIVHDEAVPIEAMPTPPIHPTHQEIINETAGAQIDAAADAAFEAELVEMEEGLNDAEVDALLEAMANPQEQ